MADSSWFFPKQQTVQPVVAPPPAPDPVPELPHIAHEDPLNRSLDDALSEIEQEMNSVAVSPTTPILSSTDSSQPENTSSSATPTLAPRLELLKHTLEDIKKNTQKAIDLLNDEQGVGLSTLSPTTHQPFDHLVPGMSVDTTRHTIHPITDHTHSSGEEGNSMEGIFDGQGMVGPDGKHYSIPPNYASKSKLVEGDVLKLTIAHNGSFIYKQIGPIARRRVMGVLTTDDETHTFIIKAEGQLWRVLTASVTYFKGVAGDEVVILVPRDKPSKWAAVENIIKKF